MQWRALASQWFRYSCVKFRYVLPSFALLQLGEIFENIFVWFDFLKKKFLEFYAPMVVITVTEYSKASLNDHLVAAKSLFSMKLLPPKRPRAVVADDASAARPPLLLDAPPPMPPPIPDDEDAVDDAEDTDAALATLRVAATMVPSKRLNCSWTNIVQLRSYRTFNFSGNIRGKKERKPSEIWNIK